MTDKKIPKKRNGYYYINDKEYVSVTKVIGETLSKPALMYWYGKMAAQAALRNPELNEKEVMAEVQLAGRKASDRGKYVHMLAELLCKGDLNALQNVNVPVEYAGYYRALLSWNNTMKPETIAMEVETYSDKYGYAGRTDLIAKMGSDKWVIDFKTGKNIYKEVELQLAAYKEALKEQEIVEVDKMGVVLLMENGEFQFKETRATIDDFVDVKKVWEWLKRKDEV